MFESISNWNVKENSVNNFMHQNKNQKKTKQEKILPRFFFVVSKCNFGEKSNILQKIKLH